MDGNAYRGIVGLGQKPPGPGGGGGGGNVLIKSGGRRAPRQALTSRGRRWPELSGVGLARRFPFADTPRRRGGMVSIAGLGQPPELTPEQTDALERWLIEQVPADAREQFAARCAEPPPGCERVALPNLQLGARMARIVGMDLSQHPEGMTIEQWAGYIGLQFAVAEQNVASLRGELKALRDRMQTELVVAGSPSAAAYIADVLSLIDLRAATMDCELKTFQALRCGYFVLMLDASTGRLFLARREDVERVYGPPAEIVEMDYQGLGVDPVTWILVAGIFVVVSVGAIAAAVSISEVYAAKNMDAGARAGVIRSMTESADALEKAAAEARARGDARTAAELDERARERRTEASEVALEAEERRGTSEEREAAAEAGTGIKEILMWGLVALFILKGMEHL